MNHDPPLDRAKADYDDSDESWYWVSDNEDREERAARRADEALED